MHHITVFRIEYILAGVEAESELESDSESIFSGRSLSRSQSRLEFVDSAALTVTGGKIHAVEHRSYMELNRGTICQVAPANRVLLPAVIIARSY